METQPLAIIGAGMAGLTLARQLQAAGRNFSIFDKGRRPGGRLATRRGEAQHFNHGCQFFTLRDAGFGAAMRGAGAAPWAAAGAACFAGVPDMASVAETLADGLGVRASAHVSGLTRDGAAWRVEFKDGTAQMFGTVALAIPAQQAASLLASLGHRFTDALAAVRMAPCWTVMLGFDGPVAGPDVLRPENSALGWLARENSRPGAAEAPVGYTVQATAAWSRAHLEDDAQSVLTELTNEFARVSEITALPARAAAHRWRYALAEAPLGEPCLWDAELRLGLCGDWCLAGRLEAAFLSGAALGIRLANDH